MASIDKGKSVLEDEESEVAKKYRQLAGCVIGKFEEKSKLYTWLYRIATNESIRLLNNKKIDLSASEDISGKLINTLKENATESADSILIKFFQGC